MPTENRNSQRKSDGCTADGSGRIELTLKEQIEKIPLIELMERFPVLRGQAEEAAAEEHKWRRAADNLGTSLASLKAATSGLIPPSFKVKPFSVKINDPERSEEEKMRMDAECKAEEAKLEQVRLRLTVEAKDAQLGRIQDKIANVSTALTVSATHFANTVKSVIQRHRRDLAGDGESFH